MIFHVIGNPRVPTSSEHTCDAFTTFMIQFCRYFHANDHKIIFYGCKVPNFTMPCTKFVPIISFEKYAALKKETNNFTDPRLLMDGGKMFPSLGQIEILFEQNLRRAIDKKYNRGDIMLHFFDTIVTGYKRSDIIHVQAMNFGGWHLGFDYVVFSTHTWRTRQIMIKGYGQMKKNTVIKPWIYTRSFEVIPPVKRLKDTFLFLARISNYKGFDIFLQLAKKFPQYKFIAAGGCVKWDSESKILTGDMKNYDLNPFPNVTYLGVVKGKIKRQFLSSVSALIQPTRYAEPFGINAIEAMASGTPVLASDSGSYQETIKDGITGFLCRLDSYSVMTNEDYSGKLDDWFDVIENKKYAKLNPVIMRSYVENKFNPEKSYEKYIRFFNLITEK